MVTLEEAIKHAREKAKELRTDHPQCAAQHDQLATWLEELVSRRQKDRKENHATDTL